MLHHPNMANNDEIHNQSSQQTKAANIMIKATAINLMQIAAKMKNSITAMISSNQDIHNIILGAVLRRIPRE